MADCDNVENALACAAAGADFVGTNPDDIDFDFVHTLATQCPAKVIAEGTSTTRSRPSRRWKPVPLRWWWAVPLPARLRSRPALPVPSTLGTNDNKRKGNAG